MMSHIRGVLSPHRPSTRSRCQRGLTTQACRKATYLQTKDNILRSTASPAEAQHLISTRSASGLGPGETWAHDVPTHSLQARGPWPRSQDAKRSSEYLEALCDSPGTGPHSLKASTGATTPQSITLAYPDPCPQPGEAGVGLGPEFPGRDRGCCRQVREEEEVLAGGLPGWERHQLSNCQGCQELRGPRRKLVRRE